jgi:hypothetical protein
MWLWIVLLFGFLWSMWFFRDHPLPVWISLTTTPERLQSPGLHIVLRRLLEETPERILLCIPYVYRRTNEPYQIPDWIVKMHPQVTVVRCEDDGPRTKLSGASSLWKEGNQFPIVIVDDDILYRRGFLSKLVHAHRREPNAIHCFHMYMEPHWVQQGYPILIPEGYSGCIGSASSWSLLLQQPQPSCCRNIDDHWMGYQLDQLNIPVRMVIPDAPWDISMDRKGQKQLNAGSEAHYKLCEHSGREALQKACLTSLLQSSSSSISSSSSSSSSSESSKSQLVS